ncbi:MAG: carboxylating nicotinate-nucleotide diphosphorylase [Fibrobacteraceae bacterium]|jgi:nicotinate-nucleotide pyrophosphorylase (carboxylating)|nr:carboxylating nicotinate-nucleotide diphosphorylase [Fibrobacteraceae bacterium]
MYGDNSLPVFPKEDALTMIRLALAEDVRTGDVTSAWTIPENQNQHARLIAKEDGVLAGLPIIELVFNELKANVNVVLHKQDGDCVKKGDLIAELSGSTRELLTGERTLLNFIQQLSGVATVAHIFQEALKGGKTKVLDTRKTLPGFRTLQKYAVRVGGGSNHRMGLFDMVLVKDNHIAAAGGVLEALEVVKKNNAENLMVEMEVESLEDLKKLLHKGVDVIMLDNMSNEMMAEALEIIKESGDKVLVEGSGNMTLERAKEIATLGLDYISVGALTHSVKALDISMRI